MYEEISFFSVLDDISVATPFWEVIFLSFLLQQKSL